MMNTDKNNKMSTKFIMNYYIFNIFDFSIKMPDFWEIRFQEEKLK